MDLRQFSTDELKLRFEKEQTRVFTYLMNIYPISQESLEHLLADLKLMHEELKRRKEQG